MCCISRYDASYGGGVTLSPLKPVKLIAETLTDKVKLKISETVAGTKIDLTSDNVVTNKSEVGKWRLYHAGDTEATYEGPIDNITSFTPKKPGHIWLRMVTPNEKEYAYFKIAVKADENTPAPAEYTETFAKEDMKPLKAPIQMGYFRTWHDYWSWVPDDASNKMSDVPAEVDIVSVFHDYTEDGNPFWEKLKLEYVPKLNKQGTRVIRTIGIKDVDGRRGVSNTFQYTKDAAGYKALAEEIVKEYVTKYNLDGLDIDFEYHDSHDLNSVQAKAVIKEISGIIGPKNPNRRANMLFLLDTNKEADENDGIFKETHECFDYVIRQNYQGTSYLSNFNSYKNILPKEKYLTGFTYYEEGDNNNWNNVPNEDLVADRSTNETKLSNPDELFEKDAFKKCIAYKQAEWAAKGGYAGVFSYAIDRDGIANGNIKKFFKIKEGGHPSKYFFSKALKHLMEYETAKDVADIKLATSEFKAGNTLELNANVEPSDSSKKDITWTIVAEPQKTTAKDAAITNGNKLTAKSEGKITLKAVVQGGKKGESVPKFTDYEKEFEIKVTAAPVAPAPHIPPVYQGNISSVPVIPTVPDKKEEQNAKTSTEAKQDKKEETKKEEVKKEEANTEVAVDKKEKPNKENEKISKEFKKVILKKSYTVKTANKIFKNISNNLKAVATVKETKTIVTWKKIKGISGYTIYAVTKSGKMKAIKDIKKTGKTKFIQKLSKTAKKYIIVAYKLVDGKKQAIVKSQFITTK